jgi:hypothetical protein
MNRNTIVLSRYLRIGDRVRAEAIKGFSGE